jgi:bacterioferritin (cytochrome b1)
MDKAKVIDKLNEAIAVELCALLQYNQYSQVITGTNRKIWEDFFHESSEESFEHARKFGSKVVALGGTPCVEPQPVKQTTDLTEMLENSLELEKRAVKAYTEALALCEDNPAYRNMLEDQIEVEVDDVEEIEKYLGKIKKVASKGKSASKSA